MAASISSRASANASFTSSSSAFPDANVRVAREMSMARVFPRVASSRARTPRDGARARRARLTTTRATTENGGDGDAGAKKVGRFVRNDGATPRAPLGSGPGDVGPAGVAPPTSTMNVKVIPLEETRFQGVANAAKAETAAERNYRIAQLVVGDCAALLAFAAIGRGNHGEGMYAADVAATAAPFALGWFGAMKIGDSFGKDARGSDGMKAAVSAGKTWAVAGPVGLALRALGKGAAPPAPFVVVSLTFAGAFLIGWRYWFANSKSDSGRGNKQGNPLEFMNLLFGLVKRW
jgi:hypothetical protein